MKKLHPTPNQRHPPPPPGCHQFLGIHPDAQWDTRLCLYMCTLQRQMVAHNTLLHLFKKGITALLRYNSHPIQFTHLKCGLLFYVSFISDSSTSAWLHLSYSFLRLHLIPLNVCTMILFTQLATARHLGCCQWCNIFGRSLGLCLSISLRSFFFFPVPIPFLEVWTLSSVIKNDISGLPWWRSGWESACQCRGHGFEPWSGKIPHATERLGPWATVTEPVCLEPVLRNKRGRDSERPAHRDEEWSPLATTRESPCTETKTQHSHK